MEREVTASDYHSSILVTKPRTTLSVNVLEANALFLIVLRFYLYS
jgi:hypothetical protein